jgi:transcriptional regulator with XRE-family HTH domain
MFSKNSNSLGEIIRRQRVALPLTQQELAAVTGVSPSYLGRIERGERFPSARVLRRIAKPLGFGEDELFTLAGYLSPHPSLEGGGVAGEKEEPAGGQSDPYVLRLLAQEPIEVQRAVIAILTIMKDISRSLSEK